MVGDGFPGFKPPPLFGFFAVAPGSSSSLGSPIGSCLLCGLYLELHCLHPYTQHIRQVAHAASEKPMRVGRGAIDGYRVGLSEDLDKYKGGGGEGVIIVT